MDEIELLENLSSTGTWYLDLRNMRFTEISEKIFELYGISKGDSRSYESFLFNCVLLDDQAYCEQKRLEIMTQKDLQNFCWNFASSDKIRERSTSSECLSSEWKMRRVI